MAKHDDVVRVLLERHGTTYAEELGLDVARNSPADLFRLLTFTQLASARIAADLAVSGARALADAGWTTAERLADAGWEARAETLNESGYARYDERTASMLGDACALLLECYDGDLRQLRAAADGDPDRASELLQELKGIGPTGADIFLREVQVAWDELEPYVDDRARESAGDLGLPTDPKELAGLVARADIARLVAALVRCALAGDADELREAASA